MFCKVCEATSGDDEEVEVREQIGEECVLAGGAREYGPTDCSPDIADPIKKSEQQHTAADAVETPSRSGADLRDAQGSQKPSAEEHGNTE